MANIRQKLYEIMSAVRGKDIRKSIHDGIDAMNKETEASTELTKQTKFRQDVVTKQFDDQIKNMTLEDPSSAELVAFRTSRVTGKSFETGGARGDDFDEQLEQTNKELTIVGQKVLDVVSLNEYKHLAKSIGALKYDWSDALQAILNDYNGEVEIKIPYRKEYERFYIAKRVLAPKNARIHLRADVSKAALYAADEVEGNYLIEMQGGYFDIEGISFFGNNKDGLTLFGGKSGGYGGYRLHNVELYHAEYGIKFDDTCEFPLGGEIGDLWCFRMRTGGIKLGTDKTPTSGQSCHSFDNIRINNLDSRGIKASNINVQRGTNSDTINWSNANEKEYGWVVMRRPQGSSDDRGRDWVNVGNINAGSTLTLTVSKVVGTEWQYTVVRRTVGMHIRHLKAATFGVLQSEYFGTGLLAEFTVGTTIGTFYDEWRGNSSGDDPIPAGDGIEGRNVNGFSVLGGWKEGGRNLARFIYSTGTYVTGCEARALSNFAVYYMGYTHDNRNKIGNIHIVGTTLGVVGTDGSVYSQSYTVDNPYKQGDIGADVGNGEVINHGRKSYLELQQRGNKKLRLEATSEGGAVETNVLKLEMISKNLMPPLANTSNIFTSLSNNNTVSFLNAEFPVNSTTYATFKYLISVVDSDGVNRQTIVGEFDLSVIHLPGEGLIHSLESRKIQTHSTNSSVELILSAANQGTGVLRVRALVRSSLNNVTCRISIAPISLIGANAIYTQL